MRVATEVAADPVLRGPRVGDVAVDALGGDPVPLSPAPEEAAEGGPAERLAALGERPVALVPGVAEGVVAVADVDRLLLADHRVSPGARARDDEVIAGQVERLDRGRIQRQECPEGPRVGPQAL